ncbi:unnamed protein product [Kuraishia capsulata CBS 1993]|uniref:Xylanolytic transcriptional activator regulatory domain-containing protein n=1 Tax=Kuraishia capsulata CBS 1993 TaxID=1382522 RepID=W6MN46_9ASCO|nr:uncharacterized protein KUCA_T00004025001 [Kuraishia capsulata CBS 1993]CDK28044.1 unnamed protein product [Kuraishia capsulata CBS 1993]
MKNSDTVDGVDGTPLVFPDILKDKATILQAVRVFFDLYGKIPFFFFRRHEFYKDLENGKIEQPVSMAIVTVVARFMPTLFSKHEGNIEASEYYAQITEKILLFSNTPTLSNIQARLIFCFHLMGHGREYSSWLHLGTAIRMAQILRLQSIDGDEQVVSGLGWGVLNSRQSNSVIDDHSIDLETKRRTFWCCFLLDRILSNGRDRPVSIPVESIHTNFPCSETEFLYPTGNHISRNFSFKTKSAGSLLGQLMLVIEIFGRILAWQGLGGRMLDRVVPWDPSMPVSAMDSDLEEWHNNLPFHYKFTKENLFSQAQLSESRLWVVTMMFYFQAKCYLHREYYPFLPPPGFDPANGPVDGPELVVLDTSDDVPLKAREFWKYSSVAALESAHNISALFQYLVVNDDQPYCLPFLGICLQTADTIHSMYSHFTWPVCDGDHDKEKKLLMRDVVSMVKFEQFWPLAALWLRAIRKYYAVTGVAARKDGDPSVWMNGFVKDQTMNFIREMNIEHHDDPVPEDLDIFTEISNHWGRLSADIPDDDDKSLRINFAIQRSRASDQNDH